MNTENQLMNTISPVNEQYLKTNLNGKNIIIEKKVINGETLLY